MFTPLLEGQQALGPCLHVLRSPDPHSTVCLILSHGSHGPGDGYFQLSAGMTMRAWVPHGHALRITPRTLVFDSADVDAIFDFDGVLRSPGGPYRRPALPPHVIHAGQWIANYRLSSVQLPMRSGALMPRHEFFLNKQMKLAYQESWARDRPGCPHLLQVRLDAQPVHVHLLDAVNAVRAWNFSISEFHLGFCRSLRMQ